MAHPPQHAARGRLVTTTQQVPPSLDWRLKNPHLLLHLHQRRLHHQTPMASHPPHQQPHHHPPRRLGKALVLVSAQMASTLDAASWMYEQLQLFAEV